MKLKIQILLVAIALTFDWRICAQTYDTNGDYVQTFAGSGFSGYVNGVAANTMFDNPNLIVADSHSNLFVWDSGNYRIREIAPDSTVSTFVGGGTQSTGIGTNVNFASLNATGMTIDHNNTIWMVGQYPDAYYESLYKITSAGVVTSNILFYVMYSEVLRSDGICADSYGNIYISWSGNYGSSSLGNNIIYRYSTNGVLSVFAGSGNPGYADGNGVFTAFNWPQALAADAANNIYVWDLGNRLIRRIDQNQNVTTFAGHNINDSELDGVGTNAAFNSISQMCFDNSGNLYLACWDCIRKIDAQTNTVTMAGNFIQSGSYTNGAGSIAWFSGADGVCVSGGTIYLADSGNQRIRDITLNPSPQIVSPANLQLSTYPGLQITGIVGRTYQIQTSPDLNSWSTKTTILLNSSPYLWIDQNPVSGSKFYRALLLP